MNRELNLPGLNCWAGIWSGGIVGSFFFDSTVTGLHYHEMLEEAVIPEFSLRSSCSIIFGTTFVLLTHGRWKNAFPNVERKQHIYFQGSCVPSHITDDGQTAMILKRGMCDHLIYYSTVLCLTQAQLMKNGMHFFQRCSIMSLWM